MTMDETEYALRKLPSDIRVGYRLSYATKYVLATAPKMNPIMRRNVKLKNPLLSTKKSMTYNAVEVKFNVNIVFTREKLSSRGPASTGTRIRGRLKATIYSTNIKMESLISRTIKLIAKFARAFPKIEVMELSVIIVKLRVQRMFIVCCTFMRQQM